MIIVSPVETEIPDHRPDGRLEGPKEFTCEFQVSWHTIHNMSDNSYPPPDDATRRINRDDIPPPQGRPYGQPSYGQQSPPPYGQPPYGQQPPPPYGQAPYGAPPQYGAPPPQGAAAKVRPSGWWILAGWLVAVVCTVVGVVIFIGSVAGTVRSFSSAVTFASGQTKTLTLDPADKPMVYLQADGAAKYECNLEGGTGAKQLVNQPNSTPLMVNGKTWYQILAIKVPSKGQYQLTCSSPDAPTTTFGVAASIDKAVSGVLGSALILLLLPGLGVLIAIVVNIVIVVRRNRFRRRLMTGQ